MARPSSDPPPNRRAVLLINPGARHGRRAEVEVTGALERQGLVLDRVVRVRRSKKITRAVATLLEREPAPGRLIVGGGDGTISAVAPFLARRDVLLGVIPLGTANDFARAVGIPTRLEDAAAVAAGSHVRAIDLGRANDAYFLNVASIGMSVALTRGLSPRLKRWLGPAAYAIAGAAAFIRHPTFRATLTSADGCSEAVVHQVVVGNGRFYGGGVLVASGSTLDDGKLAAYTLGSRSRWQLLRTVALLKLKAPLNRPGDSFLQTESLRVESEPVRRVNLDGEIRTRTPVEFRVEPRALRVLTPAEPAPGLDNPATVLGSEADR